jgi:acetyltransferase-like isoleucine patch superfamily enzyme
MALIDKIAWRLRTWLIRCAQWHRVLFYRLISTNKVVGSFRRVQALQCAGTGVVSIDRVSIGVRESPFFLSTYAYLEARHPTAKISIGAGTRINNNFCAIADHASIQIGRNCLIGANVEILDSDFHGLAVEDRGTSLAEWAQPVSIDDNVFIGSNVRIMKGVTIGNGSIIANGSVVTRSVEAGVIAGGNPAKILKVIATRV